jgi:hypothetical protein
MGFDPRTNTITLTRGDDRRILFEVDGPPWASSLQGFSSGTLTARNSGRTWVTDRVTLVKRNMVAVDLTHWQTAQPAGAYLADVELLFDGGPVGPPGDPRSGKSVWTIWQGRIDLRDDQTKED